MMKFCTRPFEDLYIREDYVKICPWMYQDTIVGAPLEQSILEMWSGEKAERIRDSIREGSFHFCNKETCPRYMSGGLIEISEEEGKEYKAEKYPKNINIAYDKFCNHICPSCRSQFYRPDDRYREKMKRLKEVVLPVANKAEMISACGMGDCFSSPFMMEFLHELRPENPNFNMAFETNGVYFDEDHWEKISHLHKYPISVSVTPNSFEKYTYRYLAGGIDDLDKCKDSLDFLGTLRRENKISKLNINMVVQEANYWEIPSFIQWCLEKYDPDLIQIKPLNRWFSLNAEGYWFKNVLNPRHPYHENYLKVMEDPIVKHPKVKDWTKDSHDRDPRWHPAVYNDIFVDLLHKVMTKDNYKQELSEKFRQKGIKNIAIYGAWKYGEILFDILSQVEGTSVLYFIDKRLGMKQGQTCRGREVKSVFFEDFSDVDTIMISALAARDEIVRDLNNIGFSGNIVAVNEIV